MQGTPRRLAVYSVRRAEQRRSFLADVSAALGVPSTRRRLSSCSRTPISTPSVTTTTTTTTRCAASANTSLLDRDITALFTEDDVDDIALPAPAPAPEADAAPLMIDPEQQITRSDDAAAPLAPPQAPPRLQHEPTVPLPGARSWCEIDTRERHTGPCAVESGATPFAAAAAAHASTTVLAPQPPLPSPSPSPSPSPQPAQPRLAQLGTADSALTVSQVAAHSRFALAPAQLDRVHAALSQDEAQTGPDDVVAVVADTALTRLELQCLRPANWLTDTVINAYMDLVAARSAAAPHLPRTCALSTFFYTKLARSSSSSGGSGGTVDGARMAAWTRGVDVLRDCDVVLVPVHMGNHWCLAVVNVRARAFEYYDSLGQRGAECLALLRAWVAADAHARHGDEAGTQPDLGAWADIEHSDIPVQQNGSDCGVFACKYAECVAAGRPCDFTQYDMNALRARMTYELLTGTLLPPPPPPSSSSSS